MPDWRQSHVENRPDADDGGDDTPSVLRVDEVRRESLDTATLLFRRPEDSGRDIARCDPGQFYMLWLPQVDEKPYALSYVDESRLGVTVMERGSFSKKLCGLQPGDRVGFRGPYGTGFGGLDGEGPAAAIGGGCGLAALALLKERREGCRLVQGAPTEQKVLWQGRFPEQMVFTEDGSCGREGVPTDWLREELQSDRLQRVYTCGPEPMMVEVVRLCREAGVPCEASLERYMKCGIGLCGSCECSGWLVCRDGPVFPAEQLARMPAFGTSARSKSGRKMNSEEGQCEA